VSPPVWTGPVDLIPVGKAPLVGDVVEFDDPRGLGVVEYGPGRRVGFHCTAITDGSRTIAVGTVVALVVAAGRLGRLEARYVRPLPGVVSPGSTLAPVEATVDAGALGGRLAARVYAESGSTVVPDPGNSDGISGSSPRSGSGLPAPFDWSVSGSAPNDGTGAGEAESTSVGSPAPESPVAESPVAEPPVVEAPVLEPPPVESSADPNGGESPH
jgi:hypothetical protein